MSRFKKILSDGVSKIIDDLLPSTTGTFDIGSSTAKFRNLYLSGVLSTDDLTITDDLTVGGDLAVTGISTLTGAATFAGDVILDTASKSVRQKVVTGITAAGANSAAATALTGVINNVTTVAASTGVRAWAAGTGTELTVRNGGANALTVYPDTGGTINGGAVDAGVSIATGAVVKLQKIAALTWIASEAPAA